MTDINKSPADLQIEVEALRAEVAALTKERDDLIGRPIPLTEWQQMEQDLAAITKERELLFKQITHYCTQLAAGQSREAKLREAMLSVLCDPEGVPCFSGSDGDRAVIAEALALPTDDAALKERLKEEREKVAQMIMNGSFLHTEAPVAIWAKEVSAAIRSMT